MKHFTLSFTVREDRLATMVSLLSGEVANLHISETNKTPSASHPTRTNTPHHPQTKWALAHEPKLFAAMTPGKTYHTRDKVLAALFPDHPPSFVGGLFSSLYRLNRVKRAGKGLYTRD